ncbi:MAG: transposase [Deltaproteobacteria bacterium]|nr:transposase [Deltaproteobacteria bacterium]
MVESKEGDEKEIRRFSAALKSKVVEEVVSGALTAREAARLYGVSSARVVNAWVFKHEGRRTKIVRVMMKSEAERIKELEEALSDAILARRVLAAQLESYERYVPDLKKRLDTKELKKFEENQKKIEKLR